MRQDANPLGGDAVEPLNLPTAGLGSGHHESRPARGLRCSRARGVAIRPRRSPRERTVAGGVAGPRPPLRTANAWSAIALSPPPRQGKDTTSRRHHWKESFVRANRCELRAAGAGDLRPLSFQQVAIVRRAPLCSRLRRCGSGFNCTLPGAPAGSSPPRAKTTNSCGTLGGTVNQRRDHFLLEDKTTAGVGRKIGDIDADFHGSRFLNVGIVATLTVATPARAWMWMFGFSRTGDRRYGMRDRLNT